VNRFGETAKSDWASADAQFHPDAQGYFDGNASYYFPQIELGADPFGRTEAYRIYRQFLGGPEEEVTTGAYSGDPQGGKTIIFDDFMP
jgi:hypothetical protein